MNPRSSFQKHFIKIKVRQIIRVATFQQTCDNFNNKIIEHLILIAMINDMYTDFD